MRKSIIFPVNNKGGVGKTSTLTDLVAALSQRHKVGVVDFDDQASLAGTLQGKDLACFDPSSYDLTPQTVQVTSAKDFAFSDHTGSMILSVRPTTTQVSVFPAGLLYDHPQRRPELARLLKKDMGDASLLCVDLPPIPHPGMILDYTVNPMIDVLGGDVTLFPLVVATPDHNVIDIALRGVEKIIDYFEQEGVKRERIHPLFVLNKVPLNHDSDGKARADFEGRTAQKLGELGILYLHPSGHYGLNAVRRHFDYGGRRFRSVVFPIMDEVEDGKFSLMFTGEARFAQFPHLVQLAKSHNLRIPAYRSPHERVYMFSLAHTVSFIEHHSEGKPQKNYVKRVKKFDPNAVKQGVVGELREIMRGFYETGELGETQLITGGGGTGSGIVTRIVPKSHSLDTAIDIIYETQTTLNPNHPVTKERIRRDLDGHRKDGYDIVDEEGGLVVGISWETYKGEDLMQLTFPEDSRWQRVEAETYLPRLDVFLRNWAN